MPLPASPHAPANPDHRCGPDRIGRSRRPLVPALVVVIGLVAAACSSGSPSDPGPGDAAPSADSADTGEAPTTTTVPAGPAPALDPDADPTPLDLPDVEPSPREDVVSALRVRFDSSFPDPLVDPEAIRSGGPPPDGIPPIDDPKFQTVASVDWLADNEPVISLEVDGDARAYPVQIMTWHEIVNDSFADGTFGVTVSYCPLCNSAIAYSRHAAGRVLDFGTSGSLLNSSLVMYDRQTESLWSHFTATAVVGVLTGTTLETLPVSTVSWADFKTAHPEGLVLSRDTGFTRDYGRNPYPGYDDVDSSPFLYDGPVDGRLPAQARVLVVRGDGPAVAIPLDTLAADHVVGFEAQGRDLVAVHEPGVASGLDARRVADGRDVGATGVFVPTVDGRDVELVPLEGGGFRDEVSGSTFDVLGRAVDGPLAGKRLEAVEHLDTFWFAIGAFDPDTLVVGIDLDPT